MNTAQATASAALSAACALADSGTLVLYNGAMPASPETALSGNTALVTLAFSATAFGVPTYSAPNMQASASFTAASYSPASSGYANFARMFESNGTTVIADLTVIAPYQTLTFTPPVGFLCTNAGNTYKATAVTGATGGTPPTGNTTSADGGVTWTYQGAGTLGDVVLGNSYVQTGTSISSPTLVLKEPAV